MDPKVSKKLEDFFAQFRHQTYKKGEILIRADEDPPGVIYLKSGKVKQYAISVKGEEQIVNIYKPVSFFPMSWAINKTQNQFYFEAVTELSVWLSPADKVTQFLKDNPEVLFDLLSRVYKGTDGLLLRTVHLMSGDAYSRVLTEILIAAKRFGKQNGSEVQINLSEKDLANQSGMARETVSREVKVLKGKGLISINKSNIVIKDLAKIENELF